MIGSLAGPHGAGTVIRNADITDQGGPRTMSVPVHRFETAGGSRWHWAEMGDGDPVVLLHGIPESWMCWKHQMPALATQFRVLAFDLKGYGRSDKADGDYTGNGVRARRRSGSSAAVLPGHPKERAGGLFEVHDARGLRARRARPETADRVLPGHGGPRAGAQGDPGAGQRPLRDPRAAAPRSRP